MLAKRGWCLRRCNSWYGLRYVLSICISLASNRFDERSEEDITLGKVADGIENN
jgi:hypothetical protein